MPVEEKKKKKVMSSIGVQRHPQLYHVLCGLETQYTTPETVTARVSEWSHRNCSAWR